MRALVFLLLLVTPALADKGFDRPVPNVQSATAELWFGLASLLFIVALYAVHRLVSRQ